MDAAGAQANEGEPGQSGINAPLVPSSVTSVTRCSPLNVIMRWPHEGLKMFSYCRPCRLSLVTWLGIAFLVGSLGHADERFWAFQPPAEPPSVVLEDSSWAATPLDTLVLAKLEKKQLRPALPADRRTLLRRVTFSLTGLPPTLDEVEAFLADDSPHAFTRVVDRLLASPRYGERWGRHWLDVARYADSNGLMRTMPTRTPGAIATT